jgi:hypothetical protein
MEEVKPVTVECVQVSVQDGRGERVVDPRPGVVEILYEASNALADFRMFFANG